MDKNENKWCLGIDTGNYSTAVAGCGVPDLQYGELIAGNGDELFSLERFVKMNITPPHYSARIPFMLEPGEKGLRQNEAVVLHTKAVAELVEEIMEKYVCPPKIVVVSDRMRDIDQKLSCFGVGQAIGRSIASALKIPCHTISHQQGHLLAAILGSQRLDLLRRPHYAYHISGGVTELLYVKPKLTIGLDVKRYGSTVDINAGQLLDRCGIKMGLAFPCCAKLDELAKKVHGGIDPLAFRTTRNVNLSGLENKFSQMESASNKEELADWLLRSLSKALIALAIAGIEDFEMPVVLTGSVMSSDLIREALKERFKTVEVKNEYSLDNAIGMAFYGAMKMM